MYKLTTIKILKSYKYISLFILLLNNSIAMILLRYIIEKLPNPQYIPSTVVFFSEFLKFFLSIVICYIFESDCNIYKFIDILKHGFDINDGGIIDMIKLCIPALLYSIQNNLQYIIETSSLFLILYQLKILTTAIFFSILLVKRLNYKEWISIFMLTIGVVMVQTSQQDIQSHHISNIIGIISVIIACITSGFAGVYFEKILRNSKLSIWIINIQLSFLGSIFSMITCLTEEPDTIISKGFLFGYNKYVIFIIILQAITGLVVALVVKYSDNIHKGYATSVAVIISGLLESQIFINSFLINEVFIIGSFFVIVSSIMFIIISTSKQLNTLQSKENLMTMV